MWMDALALRKFPWQSRCCPLVPPFLRQHIEDFAFIIDDTSQEHSLSTDPHRHFIKMPSACGAGPCSSKNASEEPPELLCPASVRKAPLRARTTKNCVRDFAAGRRQEPAPKSSPSPCPGLAIDVSPGHAGRNSNAGLRHDFTSNINKLYGGDGGIRTLDTALQPYNGLANRRLQPLGHVSA